MLDLDKHLEQWFDKPVGGEKCRFLLRYYSPEKQKEHLKACTIKSGKQSKLNHEKYVAMMVDYVVRDWEEVGGECNAENKKKFIANYIPIAGELLDIARIEQAFREQNAVELVKNFVGLSSIPTNGTQAKAEINQD